MAMLSKTVIMKGILQYVQQPSNTSLRQTKRDTTCLLPATSGDATWSTRTGNRLWSVVWWQQPGGSGSRTRRTGLGLRRGAAWSQTARETQNLNCSLDVHVACAGRDENRSARKTGVRVKKKHSPRIGQRQARWVGGLGYGISISYPGYGIAVSYIYYWSQIFSYVKEFTCIDMCIHIYK